MCRSARSSTGSSIIVSIMSTAFWNVVPRRCACLCLSAGLPMSVPITRMLLQRCNTRSSRELRTTGGERWRECGGSEGDDVMAFCLCPSSPADATWSSQLRGRRNSACCDFVRHCTDASVMIRYAEAGRECRERRIAFGFASSSSSTIAQQRGPRLQEPAERACTSRTVSLAA